MPKGIPADAMAGIRAVFFEECEEHLAELERGLEALARGAGDHATVDTVFRAAHSIKGGAAIFEMAEVVRIAHLLENALAEGRKDAGWLTAGACKTLLRVADGLADMIHAARDGQALDPVRADALQAQLAELLLEEPAAEADIEDAFTPVPVDLEALDLAPAEGEPEGGKFEAAAPVGTPKAADRPDAPQAAVKAAPSIRVDLARVETLIDLVSELVINQAILAQQVAGEQLAKSSGVPQALEDLGQLTREIQDSVMAIRAQPVKGVFQRMARLTREMESLTGKPVRLVVEGEMTEVDRTVIEHLTDPLTHMIRNAIDHGVEPTEVRAATGKPIEATVRLTAAHRGGRIVIEVADDGGGIDHERVRAKAVASGLVAADAELSPEELDNLIFEPGFSTAEEISEFSGRGVGMDVVRKSVQALGGRIAVTSAEAQGTTFTLSLPLTLAVLDGMLVSVRGQSLVAPLTALIETVQVQPQDVRRLGSTSRLLAMRGAHVPLIDLGEALGYPGSPRTDERAVALLVEDATGQRAALLVDEIHGQRQVVIKSLEANYRHIPRVAAATILGDGRVALILDIETVLEGERGRAARPEAA